MSDASDMLNLLMLKGAVADLSQSEQIAIREMTNRIRTIVSEDERIGIIVLTLLTAEYVVRK